MGSNSITNRHSSCRERLRWGGVVIVVVSLTGASLLLPVTVTPQDEPPRQEERLIFNPDEPIDQQLARRWRQDPRNLEAEQFVLKKFGTPDDFWHAADLPVAKIFFFTIHPPKEGVEEWHRIEIKEGVVRDSCIQCPDPNNRIGGILLLSDDQVQRQLARPWRQDPRNLEAEQFVLKKFGTPTNFWYVAGFPVAKVFYYIVLLPKEGLKGLHWIEIKEGIVRDSPITVPDPNNKVGGILFLSSSSYTE